MKQKDLLLVGGGFIAGYVICKMMNRNSSSESFSADGANRGYAGQQFKWNGKSKPIIQNQLFYKQTIIPNQSFLLTGKVKKMVNQGSLGWIDRVDAMNGTNFNPQTPTTDFYETNIVKQVKGLPINVSTGQYTTYTRNVYVQLDSVKKV